MTIRVTYTVRDQDILRLYSQRIQKNCYSRTWPYIDSDMRGRYVTIRVADFRANEQ